MKKLLLTLVLFLCLSTIVFAAAGVPEQISIQGRLMDSSGVMANKTGQNVTFILYDAVTGGKKVHEEKVTVNTDSNGVFNAVLGVKKSFTSNFEKQYWIEIKVGGNLVGKVRQSLTTSPYAITAKRVVGDMAWVNNPKGSAVIGLSAAAAFPAGSFTNAVGDALWGVSTAGKGALFTNKSDTNPTVLAVNFKQSLISNAIEAKSFGDAVVGESTGGFGVGVEGTGSKAGVRGLGQKIAGGAKTGPGVWGESINGPGVYGSSIAAGDVDKAFKVDWFEVDINSSTFGEYNKLPKGRTPIGFTILEIDTTSPPVPTWHWKKSEIVSYQYEDGIKNGSFRLDVANSGIYRYKVMMVYQ